MSKLDDIMAERDEHKRRADAIDTGRLVLADALEKVEAENERLREVVEAAREILLDGYHAPVRLARLRASVDALDAATGDAANPRHALDVRLGYATDEEPKR